MADALSPGFKRTSRVIKASREALYRAFTDPAALAVWLAPDQMTAKVHEFDGRVGGGYQMSLFYHHPSSCTAAKPRSGKTVSQHGSSNLRPQQELSKRSPFDSADPTFAGGDEHDGHI